MHLDEDWVEDIKFPLSLEEVQNEIDVTVPGAGSLDDQEDDPPIIKLTPIRNLTIRQRCWNIRIVVITKSELYRSRSGSTLVLNLDVSDQFGDRASITGFNRVAIQLENLIEEGKTYIFSNSYLEKPLPEYNCTGALFSIVLNKSPFSTIIPCTHNPLLLPKLTLRQPILLRDCSHYLGRFVDIVAIVVDQEESRPTRNDSIRLPLRIVDMSSDKPIRLTLWGRTARKCPENIIGQVIACRGVIVKEFNGWIKLETTKGTEFEINPEIPEVEEVQNWWTNVQREQAEISNAEACTPILASQASLNTGTELVGRIEYSPEGGFIQSRQPYRLHRDPMLFITPGPVAFGLPPPAAQTP
ncbi:hypothetical protein WR25_16918 isoform B [Diploscapter pachys]|nr:hypothetical protein WR25_16918 isoform B [Diploscapter pachys]